MNWTKFLIRTGQLLRRTLWIWCWPVQSRYRNRYQHCSKHVPFCMWGLFSFLRSYPSCVFYLKTKQNVSYKGRFSPQNLVMLDVRFFLIIESVVEHPSKKCSSNTYRLGWFDTYKWVNLMYLNSWLPSGYQGSCWHSRCMKRNCVWPASSLHDAWDCILH